MSSLTTNLQLLCQQAARDTQTLRPIAQKAVQPRPKQEHVHMLQEEEILCSSYDCEAITQHEKCFSIQDTKAHFLMHHPLWKEAILFNSLWQALTLANTDPFPDRLRCLLQHHTIQIPI